MVIREWKKVGNLGELQDGQGHSLVYGEFGPDTYGLYITVDGRDACLCVREGGQTKACDAANDLIVAIEAGWRPVNW